MKRKTHGKSYPPTREYRCWGAMKHRCSNPANPCFDRYGGRGIRVCEEWAMSFEAFYEHMGPCPPGHSIDRIDNSRGYEPGNCRWASWTEQQRNRRSNRLVVVFGLPMTLTEACEGAKISLGTVRSRLEKGWNIHNALFAPLRPGRALKEVLGE